MCTTVLLKLRVHSAHRVVYSSVLVTPGLGLPTYFLIHDQLLLDDLHGIYDLCTIQLNLRREEGDRPSLP